MPSHLPVGKAWVRIPTANELRSTSGQAVGKAWVRIPTANELRSTSGQAVGRACNQTKRYLYIALPVLALIFMLGAAVLRFATPFTRAASATGAVVFQGTISPLVARSHLD